MAKIHSCNNSIGGKKMCHGVFIQECHVLQFTTLRFSVARAVRSNWDTGAGPGVEVVGWQPDDTAASIQWPPAKLQWRRLPEMNAGSILSYFSLSFVPYEIYAYQKGSPLSSLPPHLIVPRPEIFAVKARKGMKK